jgi:hypothetical protein
VATVRLYARRTRIYIDWRPEADRVREPFTDAKGRPFSVADAELACKLAERLADLLQKQRFTSLREALEESMPKERTLGELLESLHRTRAGEWRPTFQKLQNMYRSFWLGVIRPSTPLREGHAHSSFN